MLFFPTSLHSADFLSSCLRSIKTQQTRPYLYPTCLSELGQSSPQAPPTLPPITHWGSHKHSFRYVWGIWTKLSKSRPPHWLIFISSVCCCCCFHSVLSLKRMKKVVKDIRLSSNFIHQWSNIIPHKVSRSLIMSLTLCNSLLLCPLSYKHTM